MINELLLTSTLLFSGGARNNELNTTYYQLPTLESGTFDLCQFLTYNGSYQDNRFYVEITPHQTTLTDTNNNQYVGYEFEYNFYYNNGGILDYYVEDNQIFNIEIINGKALYYDLKEFTQNQYWEVRTIANTNQFQFTEYLFDNETYSTELSSDYNITFVSDTPVIISDYMSENYMWYEYIYECQVNYSYMLEMNIEDKLSDIYELEESIDNLQNDIGELEDDISEYQDTIFTLEDLIDGLEDEISSLTHTIYNLNETISSLQAPQTIFEILTDGFESIGSVLNFEIVPHISIGLLFSIPIIGAILFFVIKLLVV